MFRTGSVAAGLRQSLLVTGTLNTKRLSVVEPATAAEVKAGSNTLKVHSKGYPLASTELMKAVVADQLAMTLTGSHHVEIKGVLKYHADEKRADTNGRRMSTLAAPNTECICALSNGHLEILEFPRRKSFAPRASFVQKHVSQGSRVSRGSVKSNKSKDAHESTNSGGAGLTKTLDLPLSHIHSIFYPAKSTDFELAFNYPSNPDDELEEPTKEFTTVSVRLRCSTAETAENWVKHFLLAVSDQVLLIDNIADTLRKKEELEQESSWNVEDLLRLSVDMLTLAKGPRHVDVAKSQERLAEYLRENGDNDNEALFWEDRAKEINEVLSKEDIEAFTFLEEIMAEVDKNGIASLL
mmetsp:Transcript_20703/g.26387  ORF Transcript_20703/g.26387 Transcript_20703/m.26387 type:complete len:353 (+) Transcript_20703:378-1436(+)